ncbi:MAG: ATP synthase F0 subunit B [Mariprofundaceae bacterium]|nr:ATP synthase F0 subunit B [Mariprofundaceae bacterium]
MPQFDSSLFDPELLWIIAIFAVIFGFLKYMILPRMAAALDQRSRSIAEELEKARALREETEQQTNDYRKQIDEAAEETSRMLDESSARIREQQQASIEALKADVKRTEESFREESEITRQRALQEIHEAAADIVLDPASQNIHDPLAEAIEKLESGEDTLRKH